MPRVLFLEDFDYKPHRQQTFSYKKGDVVLVKQEVADLAVKNKKAELTRLDPPSANIANTIKKFPNKKKPTIKNEINIAENLLEEHSLTKEEALSEVTD